MTMAKFLAASAALGLLALAGSAQAAGTITSGGFTVGIGDNGELYDTVSGVGFLRGADGYDPLAPATKRDSWGVNTILGSAWADSQFFGNQNLTGTVFGAFGGASTTATTTTSVGVSVTQRYSFDAPNILRVDHIITNTGTAPTPVTFQRNWDLDVDPTQFAENSFWPGDNFVYPPAFLDSTAGGFENPDPAVAYGNQCVTVACNVQGDLGGGIKISLGLLDAGESTLFTYWYGINNEIYRAPGGQDVDSLIAQARGLGVSYLIATQSSENGIHPGLGANSGFIGIAGIPEPATWAMLIAGFGLVGFAVRRRRDAVAAS